MRGDLSWQQWFELPDDVIVVQRPDGGLSKRALLAKVAAMQLSLQSKRYRRCAIVSDDVESFLVLFLACLFSGIAIELPANNSRELMAALQADCVLDASSCEQLVDEKFSPSALDWAKIDATQVTLYTSGSTGVPLPIARKFNSLGDEVNTLHQQWPEAAGCLFVSTVSQQHIYGLLFKILWPLLAGSPIYYQSIPFEESLAQVVERYPRLVFVSTPAFLKRMQSAVTVDEQLLSFSSGGMLTDEQHTKAESCLQGKLWQVYGSSETGGIAYRAKTQAWQFFAAVEHKVEQAVLWVKSSRCFQPDWVCTNDRVELGENGFRLLGRADRIVKLEGKRVALNLIERHLQACEWVLDAAAVLRQGRREAIAVVLVLSKQGKRLMAEQGDAALKQQLRQYLSVEVETVALPRYFRMVEQMPVNQQGKTTTQQLLELFR